jgi:putative membrane protein (TIGR04086 family)
MREGFAVRSSSSVVTGLLITFGIVLIGALFTSVLLITTDVRESSLPYFTYAINFVALLVGGFFSGKRSGNRGWYYGGLTGLAYFALIFLIGYLGYNEPMKWTSMLFLLGAFLVSAMGGILGVNTVANGRK